MSEIHFDQDGEPNEPHTTCTEIRWRYFPNPGTRGAPRIVHDKRNGGAPLYTPVDVSYVELRDLVDGVAGYYRGDQVDQSRRLIPGVKPFYVSIAATPRNAAGGGNADELVRHLVESNTRQSETLINQLAAVMREQRKTLKETRKVMRAVATADLRELFKQFAASVNARDEEDQDDDEEEDADDGANGVMQDIKDIAREVSSAFETWMLDRAAQRAEAAKMRATPPPPATPSPPAPPPSPAPPPPVPPPAAPPAASAPASPASSTASVPPAPAEPATERRNAASPMPTPEQAAHLMAILQALEPPERAVAKAVVKRMGNDQRARWLAELSALTVEQSVELVRAAIRERPKKESES